MNGSVKTFAISFVWILAALSPRCLAQDRGPAPDRITLPTPVRIGGMSLNEALATRRSIRSFAPTKLTDKEISQLLWAAQGVTDDKGHRTAPSARAQYFLHIYLAEGDGFFEYVPEQHQLRRLDDKDLRARMSSQPAVTSAPVVFLITGEYERAGQANKTIGTRWVDLEAGHAAQNLLLQATALHLAAVPVGGIQPEQIMKVAPLPPDRSPIYLVPAGHAK